MRIIHVLNHVRRTGNGVVNLTIDLACDQADVGHEVAVVSSGGEFELLLREHGVKHYHCDQRRTPIKLVFAFFRFLSIVADFEPDIVHAEMTTGMLLALIAKWRGRYGIVSSIHTHRVRKERLMGFADVVIAVSKNVSDTMIRNGIAAKKLFIVLPGPIGSPRARAIDKLEAMPLERPSITIVAGMNERKGIAELLDAFERLAPSFPTAHLYLVGDGPERLDFERLADALSSRRRIHFVGFSAEPMRYLLATDIFTLPSREEPAGLVLAEAREAGCAIVASDVGGIAEMLDNGSAGVLIPPRDPRRLSDALAALLRDPKQRRALATAGRQNLERMTVRRMSRETLEVYRRLVPDGCERVAARKRIDSKRDA